MTRKMSVPVVLALLAGITWSNDSTTAQAPASGFEPVFSPTPAPMFNPEPTAAAAEPAAAPATTEAAAAPADSSVMDPATATVAEEAPIEPQIEVIPQAAAPTDPKSVQMAKENALKDSIASTDQAISNACANLGIAPLTPKDEFETSDAFNKRKTSWEKSRDEKCSATSGALKKKREDFVSALKDAQKHAAKLKGSIEITSNPKGARIFIDDKEMGKTPFTMEDLWAGKIVVRLALDGYQEFVATPEIKADDEIELTATLQEKGIFSEPDEVNLSALLAKDTQSVMVYQARIARIQSRLAQVKDEFESMLQDQQLRNPLQPKNEFETQAAFDKRQGEWKKKNEEQTSSIRKKYDTYHTRLSRAIEVLQDYILVQAGNPKTLSIPASEMTLNTYNADAAKYSFAIQHDLDGFAFHYEGDMKMEPADAKATNKVSDGFTVNAKYYDIPVIYNGAPVYPAWNSLEVSKNGKQFPTDGKFKLPAVWYDDAAVAAAITRADSLRKGLINARGLDASYALNYGTGSSSSSSSRTWVWVARTLFYAGSVAAGTYGYLQQKKADDLSDDYNPMNKQQGVDKLQEIRDCELRRDRAYFASAVLAIAGTITFVF